MEIYKLVTETKCIEWNGHRWEGVEIVWSVDPVLRQFEVTLDDIRGWDKMSAMAKTAALTYLWAHFKEEEVPVFSAFISSRFGWPVTATKVTLPFEVDHEIGDASEWIEFDEDESPLSVPVAGGILEWANVHPLEECNKPGEDGTESNEDVDDLEEGEGQELSRLDREIGSGLFAACLHMILVRMLMEAKGHAPSESVEIVTSLIHLLEYGNTKREWQGSEVAHHPLSLNERLRRRLHRRIRKEALTSMRSKPKKKSVQDAVPNR